jgi:hypothetical protein
MSNFKEPQILLGSSFINDKVIYDHDILKNIGIENYIMLHRKYPNYFKYFVECETNYDINEFMPGYINILLSKYDHPKIIKSDIIKTIYYQEYFSEVSNLVDYDEKNGENREKIILNENNEKLFFWIIFLIVMVSLFCFCTLSLIYSKNFKILKQ